MKKTETVAAGAESRKGVLTQSCQGEALSTGGCCRRCGWSERCKPFPSGNPGWPRTRAGQLLLCGSDSGSVSLEKKDIPYSGLSSRGVYFAKCIYVFRAF